MRLYVLRPSKYDDSPLITQFYHFWMAAQQESACCRRGEGFDFGAEGHPPRRFSHLPRVHRGYDCESNQTLPDSLFSESGRLFKWPAITTLLRRQILWHRGALPRLSGHDSIYGIWIQPTYFSIWSGYGHWCLTLWRNMKRVVYRCCCNAFVLHLKVKKRLKHDNNNNNYPIGWKW